MARVIIAGGGWAGCGAAAAAAKKRVEVVVLERTDMLLGTGLVGGIMRNNGRFTATEEAIALGCGDLFRLTDQETRHKNIEFPGHKHASLYDVATMEPTVKKYLQDQGVELHFQARVTDVEMAGKTIKQVKTANGDVFHADVFIDTTGTAGPMNNCTRHGNGCACCILRCPSFGGRVSLTAKAGVEEMIGVKKDGSVGAMSGSCKLLKESLAPAIVEELNRSGVAIIPIPANLAASEEKLAMKACQQYALKEFAENIILLDTGHAKLMSPYFPLELLRKVPGMQNARYEDPYAGGLGNSMRYMGMAPRNDALQVEGVDNLFCAGEKAGLLVGHTEAIVTGSLAGYNAACQARGEELLILPDSLVIGDAITFVRTEMQTEEGKTKKYTFSGSVLFERMKQKGFYSTNLDEIRGRVAKAGLLNVMLG